jgi:hypothetical protein
MILSCQGPGGDTGRGAAHRLRPVGTSPTSRPGGPPSPSRPFDAHVERIRIDAATGCPGQGEVVCHINIESLGLTARGTPPRLESPALPSPADAPPLPTHRNRRCGENLNGQADSPGPSGSPLPPDGPQQWAHPPALCAASPSDSRGEVGSRLSGWRVPRGCPVTPGRRWPDRHASPRAPAVLCLSRTAARKRLLTASLQAETAGSSRTPSFRRRRAVGELRAGERRASGFGTASWSGVPPLDATGLGEQLGPGWTGRVDPRA